VESHVDKRLIDRCLGGDQSAWNDLVLRYQRLVYSVANIACSNRDDVSDVFQQVWMELYQRLHELRNIEALPAWLITVTRRRAWSAAHSRYNPDPLSSDIPDLKEQLAQVEREHEVERALDLLSERCRRLIDLLYFDVAEPRYAEVALTMGMPEASIGPTRARCLEKLRKLLE
jgi:RNA polymerase sigma factor (sigma-70 family)